MFQQQVFPLAQRIMSDDAFGEAISSLCNAIPQIFRGEPRLVRAIGDYGAFAVVICAVGIADEDDGEFTFAAIQAVVVPRRWASSRRTRALIDWLEWSGAALRKPPRQDNRERPWCICGWLPTAITRIAEAFLTAVAPFRGEADDPMSKDIAGAIKTLVMSVSRLIRMERPSLAVSAEMRLFASHAAGYPILLDIIGAVELAHGAPVLFSRKAAAPAYAVSRAHITAIIAKAERSGMLRRDGNEIILTKTMAVNIQQDLACQMAIVLLIAEAN
jgi:hypothetical protein